MLKRENNAYRLPPSMDGVKFADKMAGRFHLGEKEEQYEEFVYCDSFDWRLYNKGYALYSLGGRWQLVNLSEEPVFDLEQGPLPGKKLFFADFPSSSLRKLIKPILGIRALLPLTHLNRHTISWRMFNKDNKTVARLFVISDQTLPSGQVFRRVKVEGLRGYDKDVQEVLSCIVSLGIADPALPLEGFRQGLLENGRTPGDYTSKFSTTLQPDLSANEAVKSIYRQLLATMQRNETGILEDLDSEFLHDFRVAIRRTRTGLTLLKGVLPSQVESRAREDFSFLGRITGPARDLDVYRLYEKNYNSRLSPILQPHLQAFFSDLAVLRKKEQRKLIAALQSSRYQSLTANWQEDLSSEAGTVPDKGKRAVIDLARSVIYKRYKRVMKDGSAIKPKTPDRYIHRLRIQGKKLRYSVEFFSSLFPKKEISKVLKQLKQLQDNLGDFNDLSVQQEMLRNYLNGLRPGSRKNFEMAAAIGGLLTNLHHEQNSVRENFFSSFRCFSTSANAAQYKKLFT